MKLLFVGLGIVFLSAQVSCASYGCSTACGTNCATAGSSGYIGGCGFGHEESMCMGKSFEKCVPMVVRPQEIPKPATSAAAVLALTPVPGPCLYKKVIVKPAVLPKPICRPHTGHSYHGHSQSHSYSYQSGSAYGGSNPECRSVLFPGLPAGTNCAENQANCAPADAVSLALAYKLANEENRQSEDRLAFGFRRLPSELPAKKIIRKDVPEEKIFALNGQIVELKPVSRGFGSRRSLEEEAAEELLALENEEAEEGGVGHSGPIKRVSLGELGYIPAKLSNPAFVDVTPSSTAVGETLEQLNEKCSCGSYKCKVIPGDIEYKTVPKPEEICLPPIPVPDSCESGEIEIDQQPGGCTCSCVPVVIGKCHHKCDRKSRVTIHKYLN